MSTTMDFGEALDILRAGGRVARSGWNGVGILELQVPDAGSKMTLPYIFIRLEGDLVPWLPPQADILGFDWVVVSYAED